MVIGDARRKPLAMTLRRLQLLAWTGSIVAAVAIVLVPAAASFWLTVLGLILVATQLTLLTALFATLAIDRTRAIA